jgi:UPF0716 protein FxsA
VPLILLLVLLLGLPLVEIYLMIRVGSVIGAFPTVLLSIVTAIIGAWLVRVQGFGIVWRIKEALARDQIPALELVDGGLLLVAGFFLILPGFLTDTVGFVLLIPPLRRWLIARYVPVLPVEGTVIRHETRVIEGRFRRED